jgi:hypothetical protein
MKVFTFKAATLFDADATAQESNTVYHDAPGAGERLAQFKRFAVWLHSEMVKKGLPAEGPTSDEGGWMISIPAKEGFLRKKTGFVLVMVSIEKKMQSGSFDLSVTPIGSAKTTIGKVENTIERILRTSAAVTDLQARSY